CATVIESLLNVASLVWNRRIVLGGPEGLGVLKIDLSQLSIFVTSSFDRGEKVVPLRRRTSELTRAAITFNPRLNQSSCETRFPRSGPTICSPARHTVL